MQKALPELSKRPLSGPLTYERFALTPTDSFLSVLKRHTEWEKRLRFSYGSYGTEKSLNDLAQLLSAKGTVTLSDFHRALYDCICLAAMKQRFPVWKRLPGLSDPYLCGKDGVADNPSFPPGLLFCGDEAAPLAKIYSFDIINYFNASHRFSRWLTTQREALQDRVPGVYHGILKTMLLGKDKDIIRRELNTALHQLERFSDNPFGVTCELYLKEEDFKDFI